MRFKELCERLLPQSSATIVFNKVGKILILKRGGTAPWMPLRWNLPGGMVDAGEKPLQSAKREAWEEATIKPKNMKLFKVIKDAQYLLHIYTGNVSSDKVDLGDMENIEYAWVTPADLDKYNFVPYTKELIKQAFGVVQECMMEAEQVYYHGTKENFDMLKANKGFIWLAFDKKIAQEYADEKYYKKGDSRILKVKLKPNAKLLDLSDTSNKHVQEIKEKVAYTRGMMTGISTMTDKEWKDFVDFGVIESAPWITGFVKSKKYHGFIVNDSTFRNKHKSVALFSPKSIASAKEDKSL